MKKELQNMNMESFQNLESALQVEMPTVEDVKNKLILSKKGIPVKGLENLEIIFKLDPMLQNSIRRNNLSYRNELLRKTNWKRKDIYMDDTDTNNITLYIEKTYGIIYKQSSIDTMIDIMANENSYHPIIEMLESLRWDGVQRIAHALTHFLGADDIPYTGETLKMHMLAAISRLYQPGCKYDIMICLVGGQGAGKSTFFRFLSLQDDWFSDDLKRLDDKSVREYMAGHWIIEMPELDALVKAKSVEETKAFLSRQKDTYRMPYAKVAKDWPRQCVFCGTSNDLAFLPLDRTGNRRFAPILIQPEKAECHIYSNEKESREYIRQMWAEAMEIYRSGEFSLTFTSKMEEYARDLQKDFMPEDTLSGMIQAFLDDYEDDYICPAIIYQEVMHQSGIPAQWESKNIGDIMNHSIHGWEKHGTHRFKKGIGTQRSWKRITPIKDENGFMKINEQMKTPFD